MKKLVLAVVIGCASLSESANAAHKKGVGPVVCRVSSPFPIGEMTCNLNAGTCVTPTLELTANWGVSNVNTQAFAAPGGILLDVNSVQGIVTNVEDTGNVTGAPSGQPLGCAVTCRWYTHGSDSIGGTGGHVWGYCIAKIAGTYGRRSHH